MQKIKKYCEDNVHIKITDFELEDVSFYGCDAWFDFEIIDNETGALLDTDVEKVEYAFMGVDDSEDIYYFLEEKGIDLRAVFKLVVGLEPTPAVPEPIALPTG